MSSSPTCGATVRPHSSTARRRVPVSKPLWAPTSSRSWTPWAWNSPAWHFGDELLDRAAESFTNPDYVDIVIHSYRHRLGFAPGCTDYERLESALAEQPGITVPTVTLDGLADGNFPATDGASSAHYFTGPRLHRQVRDAGHNLPQERPEAFAAAVRDVRLLRQEHAVRH